MVGSSRSRPCPVTSTCSPAESRPRTSSRSIADSAICIEWNASMAAAPEGEPPARSSTPRAAPMRSLRIAQSASLHAISAAFTASMSARRAVAASRRGSTAASEVGATFGAVLERDSPRPDRPRARPMPSPIRSSRSTAEQPGRGIGASSRGGKLERRGAAPSTSAIAAGERGEIGGIANAAVCRTTGDDATHRRNSRGVEAVPNSAATTCRSWAAAASATSGDVGLDHDPHERLGARRPDEHAPVVTQVPSRPRPRPRRPGRTRPRSTATRPARSRVPAGTRAICAASAESGRSLRRTRSHSTRPVNKPSPVVAWAANTMWPDCSPPSTETVFVHRGDDVPVTDRRLDHLDRRRRAARAGARDST